MKKLLYKLFWFKKKRPCGAFEIKVNKINDINHYELSTLFEYSYRWNIAPTYYNWETTLDNRSDELFRIMNFSLNAMPNVTAEILDFCSNNKLKWATLKIKHGTCGYNVSAYTPGKMSEQILQFFGDFLN